MAVKVVNNIVGLDRLILTLLVFRAYPYINIELPLTPSIVHYVEAI
jgi:hypothetical protein